MKIKVVYCEKEVVHAYVSYYTNTAAILKNNINLSDSDKHIILIPSSHLSKGADENYESRMKEFANHFKKAKRLTRKNFTTETLNPSSLSNDDYDIIDVMNQLARDYPDKEIEFQLYTRFNSLIAPDFLQQNSATIPANISIKLYQSKDTDHYIDTVPAIAIQGTGLINVERPGLREATKLDSLLDKLSESLKGNGDVFARGIILKIALIAQRRYVELSQLSSLEDFIENMLKLLHRRAALSNEVKSVLTQLMEQSLQVLEHLHIDSSLKKYVGLKTPKNFSMNDFTLTLDLLTKLNLYFDQDSAENKEQLLIATNNLFQSHNKNPLAALGFILLGVLLTTCPIMAIAPILFGVIATAYAPILIASMITTSAAGIALLVVSNQVMKAENYKEEIKQNLYESTSSITAGQSNILFRVDKSVSNEEQAFHSLRNK